MSTSSPPYVYTQLERAQLMEVRDGLQGVQDILSLPQLVTLLTIAAEPGLSINELAEKVSVPQQTASRYVAVLLGRYQNLTADKPIMPLIDHAPNLEDPRRRALYLNEEGTKIVTTFLLAREGCPHDRG